MRNTINKPKKQAENNFLRDLSLKEHFKRLRGFLHDLRIASAQAINELDLCLKHKELNQTGGL